MGTPEWNVQLVGKSSEQDLTLFHSVFMLDLFLYKEKVHMHIYICIIYWAANLRLTLTAFFKRLLLTRCFLKQTKILLQKKKNHTSQ